MGLYNLAILEWNAFDADNQTWLQFKAHFTEAYKIWLASSGGTTNMNGYHGASNATNDDDDDSWHSIQEGVMNQLNQVQLANNAAAQAINKSVSAVTANVSVHN